MDLTTDCLEVLHHRLNSLALQFSHVKIETDSSGKSGRWVMSEIEDLVVSIRQKICEIGALPDDVLRRVSSIDSQSSHGSGRSRVSSVDLQDESDEEPVSVSHVNN